MSTIAIALSSRWLRELTLKIFAVALESSTYWKLSGMFIKLDKSPGLCVCRNGEVKRLASASAEFNAKVTPL